MDSLVHRLVSGSGDESNCCFVRQVFWCIFQCTSGTSSPPPHFIDTGACRRMPIQKCR